MPKNKVEKNRTKDEDSKRKEEEERKIAEEFLLSVYPFVLDLLEKDGYKRIQEIDFKDIHPDWKVVQDIQGIGIRENNFDKGREIDRAKGDILEAIILDLFELNWFDENVFTLRASKHDDYENGVDLIFVYLHKNNKGEYVPILLAFDVTTSQGSVAKKISKDDEEGGITNVDYFEFQREDLEINIRKSFNQIARCVIHIDNGLLKELVTIWKYAKEKINGYNLKLSKHIAFAVILQEIIIQLQKHTMNNNFKMSPDTKRSCRFFIYLFSKKYEELLKNGNFTKADIGNNLNLVRVRAAVRRNISRSNRREN
jgi:hypothetical protein